MRPILALFPGLCHLDVVAVASLSTEHGGQGGEAWGGEGGVEGEFAEEGVAGFEFVEVDFDG